MCVYNIIRFMLCANSGENTQCETASNILEHSDGGGPKPWLGPLWIATRRRDRQSLARNQLGPSFSNIIRSKICS